MSGELGRSASGQVKQYNGSFPTSQDLFARFRMGPSPGMGRPPLPTPSSMPTFLRKLADPSIKTVMLCGCGGGFDFVHSLTLYPELQRLGKKVVIGSYSFGDPNKISRCHRRLQRGRSARQARHRRQHS